MPRLASSSTGPAIVSGRRGRDGCLNCRARGKACGRERDANGGCRECYRLNMVCLGYSDHRPHWMQDPEQLRTFKDEIKQWTSDRSNRFETSPLDLRHYMIEDDIDDDQGDSTTSNNGVYLRPVEQMYSSGTLSRVLTVPHTQPFSPTNVYSHYPPSPNIVYPSSYPVSTPNASFYHQYPAYPTQGATMYGHGHYDGNSSVSPDLHHYVPHPQDDGIIYGDEPTDQVYPPSQGQAYAPPPPQNHASAHYWNPSAGGQGYHNGANHRP